MHSDAHPRAMLYYVRLMMEVAFAVAVASLALAAFVIGRTWSLVLPLPVVPAFYLGLDRQWWGDGLGDGWQFAFVLALALGVAATAVGVAGRALLHRR